MIPENSDNDKLPLAERLAYTPEEVALITPMSVKAVYAALRGGTLKGRKMTARKWLISRENLNEYLNETA